MRKEMLSEKARRLSPRKRIRSNRKRFFVYDEYHRRRATDHSYRAFGWRMMINDWELEDE